MAVLLVAGSGLGLKGDELVNEARLMVVDPGHFHAALVQKEMYSWLDKRVSVYAPLGPELLDYLNRIALFNGRRDNPTHWKLDVHTSDDPMREMLRDKGSPMATASIHFALSQLQARGEVEQVADTKAWRYLGKTE